MAAVIKDKLNLDTKLIADKDGAFFVYVNDEMIYDNKSHCGKFPEDGEIIDSIHKYMK